MLEVLDPLLIAPEGLGQAKLALFELMDDGLQLGEGVLEAGRIGLAWRRPFIVPVDSHQKSFPI